MEAASPPKRMTRARAARTLTSQPKMLSRPTATVAARTSAKRKSPSDDTEDELQQSDTMKSARAPARPRVRVKKTVEPEPSAAAETATNAAVVTKPARTRTTRKAATAGTTATEPPKMGAATKTTRASRLRKAAADEHSDSEPIAAPGSTPKKTTKRRLAPSAPTKTIDMEAGTISTLVPNTNPTPGLKSNFSRPESRGPAESTKKTVSFEEPEKENMVPTQKTKTTKAKAPTPAKTGATGMRARPVRGKAATVPAKSTRTASMKTTSATEKKPLSPKKDGANRPLSRCDDSSDDELATYEKTPMKPLMKSPVKPPASLRRPDQKPQTGDEENTLASSDNILTASVMSSPARRPPASPWKDSMKSPAKKVETNLFGMPASSVTEDAPQSPSKTSMMQSPAKRPQVPIKAFQMSSNDDPLAPRSPVKRSLFGSPAKRGAGIPFKSLLQEAPLSETLAEPAAPAEEEKTTGTEQILEVITVQSEEAASVEQDQADSSSLDHIALDQQLGLELSTQLAFPGRLSAVLPRYADPALKLKSSPTKVKDIAVPSVDTEANVAQGQDQQAPVENKLEDPMDLDDTVTDEAITTGHGSRARSQSPTKLVMNPMFRLRAKDMEDQDMYESDDELAGSGKAELKFQDTTTVDFDATPATPTPSSARTLRGGLPSSAAKAASRAIRSVSRGTKHGFTPLAAQFNDWKASSPSKLAQQQAVPTSPSTTEEDLSLVSDVSSPGVQGSPANAHYFEDEVKARADLEMEAMLEADLAAAYGDESMFTDDMMDITSEDVELAAEADVMSLMDSTESDARTGAYSQDDTASEASQEYGDENAVPIDPALMSTGSKKPAPLTPARPVMRTFHTTSKVPLKPADDTPPARNQTRSFSATKAASRRPELPAKNATVISYSPTKGQSSDPAKSQPTTPSKSDVWSTAETPARTPRRDLNTELLRGAVVFVDVHTSEGSDASAVFVELLSQMGARCVKTWTWNPSNDGPGESKIGITHVVYKDGGKRTMEKVRESNGVVQCVGVGWVLDCERHNRWVEESTHYIDTSLIPRGGRNRRKSMEPKAITNMNSSLVTPMKNNAAPPRECMTTPGNQINRRDSSLWMRTPSDVDEDEDAPGEVEDWRSDVGSMLTPVPKTPAPEAVARYAMDITPGSSSVEDDSTLGQQEQLQMQTCPPKQSAMYSMGEAILSRPKDQTVMMRLMAARRKSLQFAPKVASPLSKSWYQAQ